MDEGLESRLIIHNIIKLSINNSVNIDNAFIKATQGINLSAENKKFIYNVSLTSIRQFFLVKKIIKKLVKKINFKNDTFVLLLSSLTQLIFMNIKEYGVVNCSVELCKQKKINAPVKLINGTLRNFLRKQNIFIKEKIFFEDYPEWFCKNINNLNKKEKNNFIQSINLQPSLHIVIKDKKYLNKYLKYGNNTYGNSIAIHNKYKFSDIEDFDKGEWWVQDFSAMLPLSLLSLSIPKKIADVGSSPGGKLFQILSKNKNVTPYEKNNNRIGKLNNNLERLKFSKRVEASDFLKENGTNKFDLIVLDAPCSAIGTIRRHPEIFIKKQPNFELLLDTQKKLLDKASSLLIKNGILIYMVCSFFDIETTNQISKFLNRHKNFSISSFNINKKNFTSSLLGNEKFIHILPQTILNNITIDGYFASKLIKINN